ncbi:MAG TPA: FAD-dependent oxidoreductase [Kofleriaceae bacterium]|nr:FAD-dependent oxidoreductase [Kofleriaceae bacterium]
MGPDEVFARCRPVEEWPVFAIGVKEAGVTVASQQRRAIHLIDALCRAGVIAAGSRIAIIGAGAAGLTAAAWAARAGTRSIILERDSELLSTLRGNYTRLVHPNLYSWPDPGWNDPDASLPILSWTAAAAGVVATKIREQFQLEQARTGLIELRLSVDLNWHWPPRMSGSRVDLSWRHEGNEEHGRFAAVILAVGFGKEHGVRDGFPGYWQNDWVEEAAGGRPLRYFIHGAGDGGLTDLFRVRMANFQQGGIEGLLALGGRRLEVLAAEVASIERRWRGGRHHDASERMHAAYEALHVPWLEDAIEESELRPHPVTIVDKYPPLGQRRFPLNKLLASCFVRRAQWGVRWLRADLARDAITRTADGFSVDLGAVHGGQQEFDRVLVRRGAKPAIDAFSEEVARGCEVMARGDDTLRAAPSPTTMELVPAPAQVRALAASIAGHRGLVDVVCNLLLFLRHCERPTADLVGHPDFVAARRRALEVMRPLELAVVSLDVCPQVARRAARVLSEAVSLDVAVNARALVEAIDLVWGQRLHGRLRAGLGGASSRTFGANELHPRQSSPDDRRGVRDGGLERVALMPMGDLLLTIDWTLRAWAEPIEIGSCPVLRSLSDLQLERVAGKTFFGARHKDLVAHHSLLRDLLPQIRGGAADVFLVPEFALSDSRGWIEQARHDGCVVYGGLGHVHQDGRCLHQLVVALDHGEPRVFAKRAPTVYRHGDEDLEEDIHRSPDHTIHAVAAADDRALLVLAGEDCAATRLADLAIALQPTYVLGVGGPLGESMLDVLNGLTEHEIASHVVGFGKVADITT